MTNFVTDFGGVGDGIANNDAAFNSLMTSGVRTCELPEGLYMTTKTESDFAGVRFYGPGRIKNSIAIGVSYPGNFCYIASQPNGGSTVGNIEIANAFDSDMTQTEPHYHVLGPNAKDHFANPEYFDWQLTPEVKLMRNYGCPYGYMAVLTAPAAIGATTITVNSTAGMSINQQVGLMPYSTESITDLVTITGLTSTTISFSANPLAHAYAIKDNVMGDIIWQAVQCARKIENYGHGGHAMYFLQGLASSPAVSGVDNFFNGGNTAIWDVSLSAAQDYNYIQEAETVIADNGKDVGVISKTTNLKRTNATGGKHCEWHNTFLNSSGGQPIETGWLMHGPAKVGVDLSQGDFSSNGGAALQVKAGDKIYLDAKNDQTTNPLPFYGNNHGAAAVWYDAGRTCLVFDAPGTPGAMLIAGNGTTYYNAGMVAGTFVSAATYLAVGSSAGNPTQVVGPRQTGWKAMTGTADKNNTLATGTVTLTQLAQRVKSLEDALLTHGLIGI